MLTVLLLVLALAASPAASVAQAAPPPAQGLGQALPSPPPNPDSAEQIAPEQTPAPHAAPPPTRDAQLVEIDWQAHPAMHIPWPFFRRGLRDRSPRGSYRHMFRQTVHTPHLDASGVRIFLAAAMAAERARTPRQARRLILKQLAYVEAFVDGNSDRYALARSPAEARELLETTSKMVVIHSIEGGHHLLRDAEDAVFWADQGVALVTLIHLRDDELGGAGILPMPIGPLINRRGARHRRQGARRGLTDRGREAIVELDDAGILVDLTHMTSTSIDDALAITGAHHIPPIVTHGHLASIRSDGLAFRDAQVLEVYRQGGVFAVGLSAQGLDPIAPTAPVPADVCVSTIEMFQFHHAAVVALVSAHAGELVDADGALTADHRTRLSVGWSSDWNGWVSHSRPTHGRRACRSGETRAAPLEIDTRGLAHPGLLPEHWARLESNGMDLEPQHRSAERFLQLWEQVQPAQDTPD